MSLHLYATYGGLSHTNVCHIIDLFHRPCLVYQLQSKERKLVCATEVIKHNCMFMCNHKIVRIKMLGLLHSKDTSIGHESKPAIFIFGIFIIFS